jgi:hypothetical protein
MFWCLQVSLLPVRYETLAARTASDPPHLAPQTFAFSNLTTALLPRPASRNLPRLYNPFRICRAHLRAGLDCIFRVHCLRLPCAVQPCQPRAQASTRPSQPPSDRRPSLAHTLKSLVNPPTHSPVTRAIHRDHEPRLPSAPRHGRPSGWPDSAPERAARQHQGRVRDGVSAQC